MSERHIDVDGDRWYVKLGEHPPHPGVGTVIFFPGNGQRPYRVVEVPESRFASQDALDALDDDDLLALFHHADIMDYVHEPGADPHHDTEFARRLPQDVGTDEGDAASGADGKGRV